MVKEGDAAIPFKLPSTRGGERSLDEFRGRKVVIFFYPKDETPGCTREACSFRDHYDTLRESGAEVVGISRDSLTSHDKFRAHHGLPFELLSDADNRVATAYGAYGEKKMYGRTVRGTIRSTVLIDEDGKVEKVWSPVRVDGHVAQVVDALTARDESREPRRSKKKAKTKSAKKKTASKRASKKKAVKKKTVKRKAAKKKLTSKKPASTTAASKKRVKKKVSKKKVTKKKKVSKKKSAAKKVGIRASKSVSRKKSTPKKTKKKTKTSRKTPTGRTRKKR